MREYANSREIRRKAESDEKEEEKKVSSESAQGNFGRFVVVFSLFWDSKVIKSRSTAKRVYKKGVKQ